MKRNDGFSLLELSIALVIIGLIAGGITAGSSMIRAAELRSVITDFDRYKTAMHTFRDKYLGLPGDLKNATDFWGAEPAANCPGTSATPSTTQATCNGNGDNNISNTAAAGFGRENFRFWQHLANAELANGTFTGVSGALGVNHMVIGENSPESKMRGAAFSMWSFTAHPISFPNTNGNMFYVGSSVTGNIDGDVPHFTAAEQWGIDKKIDDGRPSYGIVRSYDNTARPNCASTDVSDTAEYLLDNESIGCNMILLLK